MSDEWNPFPETIWLCSARTGRKGSVTAVWTEEKPGERMPKGVRGEVTRVEYRRAEPTQGDAE